jgi:Fic family protein
MFKPKYSITHKINNSLLEIERARGFLEAAQLKGKWIREMQSEAIALEAHHSTHIEGTRLTLDQAKRILTGKEVPGVHLDDKKELLNYKKAMDFVSQYLEKESPISEGLIREIHKILVKGVRGDSADPGNYRKVQNYVVNAINNEIIYTPPPPYEVPHLMRELVEWLNAPIAVSPIIIAGTAQFQFVHIHPFVDGNGRTARLLCTLILYKNGYDFKRLFSLSEFYDQKRNDYYHAIQTVRSNNMDMTFWLEYFTNALKTQMLEVKRRGESAIKKDIIIERASKEDLNERQRSVLIFLLNNPSIGRAKYVELFKVSLRTANYDLAQLEKLGFIEKTGIGRAIKYMIKEPT